MNNNNWFESRNLKVLDYQDNTIKRVQDSMYINEKTVLAACPSAGKTLMTTYIIEEYLKQYPNNKIIILAHGTTILRTQFHDVLESVNPNFTYKLIESCKDYYESNNASVLVCLPQTLQHCDLWKADLLIVDEAHHFYLNDTKMINNIITQTKVSKQLLLTGTPSKFIYENLRKGNNEYTIIPVPLNTIFDAGMVADVYVEVASSNYDFTLDDYNNDYELKNNVHFKSDATTKTLDDLVEKIVFRLRSFRGNPFTNLIPDWGILLKSLNKTMIACRSIQQANQVHKYFKKKNINCALSTSENDVNSLEIERFKSEDDCLVLIVVFRGILGFNMEKLVNVVDMTTSHNIDRIFQLISRVIRLDNDNPEQKKLFIKVAPNMLTDYFKHIMSAVFMLSDNEFFTKYNGKNFNDMEIPIKRVYESKPTIEDTTDLPVKSSSKTSRKYLPINMDGLPVFQFFKNIFHKKDELLTTYCMTTMRNVRSEFMQRMPKGHWVLETLIEDALKYPSKKEWEKNNSGAYNTARKLKCLDECCKHMIKLTKPMYHWGLETCKEDALKYPSRSEWGKNSSVAYCVARRLNILDECCKHMVEKRKPKYNWTLETLIEDALKYSTIKEWRINSSIAYNRAVRLKCLDKCCKHMIIRRMPKGHWTLETLMEDSLKYPSTKEWRINSSIAYNAAVRLKCLDKCCEHMIRTRVLMPRGYWTLEKLIEDALKYPSRKDWRINSPAAYTAATRLKCLDKCIHYTKN